MHVRVKGAIATVAAGALLAGGTAVAAPDDDYTDGALRFRATLSGYEEVPPVSTTARGSFRATVRRDRVNYVLRYRGVEGGGVLFAHIHFGQRRVNGGVTAFLCDSRPGAPSGTPPCPATGGTVRGSIRAQDVVGPENQGIGRGALDELLRAMRAGVTYANVHSQAYPAGEVRGQITPRRR